MFLTKLYSIIGQDELAFSKNPLTSVPLNTTAGSLPTYNEY